MANAKEKLAALAAMASKNSVSAITDPETAVDTKTEPAEEPVCSTCQGAMNCAGCSKAPAQCTC